MTESDSPQNRRKYPRFKAPICYRPAPLLSFRKSLVNISLGGIRLYSNDKFKIGRRLEIELILPDDSILTCMTKVVWLNENPEKTEAKYDLGLQFIDVPEDKLHDLAEALGKYAEPVD